MDEQHAADKHIAAWNELVPTVLALAVETCPSNQLDTQSLCSLLQVSAASRRALQGSRSQHRLSIKATGAAVCGFSDCWLPKWAGLVAEVHLGPAEPIENWWKAAMLSQDAWSKLFAAFALCADPSSASTAAGATPAAMPLLLTGFSSNARLCHNALEDLPLVPPSLTRLELDSVNMGADSMPAALQRLSNLARLKLVGNSTPQDFLHATTLQQLSSLTSLEIQPVLSGDAKHLPASLVKLKLRFEADVRSEPPPSDMTGDAAAVDAWYDNWNPSEAEWEAARQLDLSHLPMLQCCELQQDQGEFVGDGCPDTVTVHLAAPQLTRLALTGAIRDVLGLQDSTRLQQLWLTGCGVSVPRLVELLRGTPVLLDFSWDGWSEDWDYCPNFSMTLRQQRQLAAGLSSLTQLTALSFAGLSDSGFMEADRRGVVRKTVRRERTSTREPQSVPWGRHLQGLRGLQRLELVSFNGAPAPGTADVLALTALTALTHLRLDVADDFDASVGDGFKQQMPGLAECAVHGCFDGAGMVWGTCPWREQGVMGCISRRCCS